MTTTDELRALVRYLQSCIKLDGDGAITFDVPTAESMIADSLEEAAVRSALSAPWWPELVEDILETRDFAEPGDSDEVVLGYARDVVQEYIWKRFDLNN